MTLSVDDKLKRNAVVIARRTWESIPVFMRPLKQRVNVVVTRQTDYNVKDGVHVVHSFEQALEFFSSEPLSSEIETIWNLGGVSIYKESLEKHYVHRLYLTRIYKDYKCDTLFPNYNEDHYVEIKDERVPDGVQEENDVQWIYQTYQAKAD